MAKQDISFTIKYVNDTKSGTSKNGDWILRRFKSESEHYLSSFDASWDCVTVGDVVATTAEWSDDRKSYSCDQVATINGAPYSKSAQQTVTEGAIAQPQPQMVTNVAAPTPGHTQNKREKNIIRECAFKGAITITNTLLELGKTENQLAPLESISSQVTELTDLFESIISGVANNGVPSKVTSVDGTPDYITSDGGNAVMPF